MYNLMKNYPDLLELTQYNESQRVQSLRRIFVRDIKENPDFKFLSRPIRPIKGQEAESDMSILFRHLITHEIDVKEDGQTFSRRVFELERSVRLHWIKHHICEISPDSIVVFSIEERSSTGKNVIRTYIFNESQRYVIILEPYRKHPDYYLITAYYLEERNMKKMKNKIKRQLDKIH
jgi:heterodisulfide reductase subunit B